MSRMRCLKCGRFRAPEAFPDDKYRKSGKHPYCRECKSAEQRARAKKKVETRLAELKTCEGCARKEPTVTFARRTSRLCVSCKIVAHEKEKMSRRVKTKLCSICGKQKGLESFSSPYCRICKSCNPLPKRKKRKLLRQWTGKRELDKVRRDKYKKELLDRLGGKCKHCGIVPSLKWPLACFDFHHTENPQYLISRLLHSRRSRQAEIDRELSKCIILCANCHRALHEKLHTKRRKK